MGRTAVMGSKSAYNKGVFKIDFRKLISFGKGSYIVSMPKGWIEKNNLKKGDLISVSDDGFELVLTANHQEKKPEIRDISIDANGKDMEMLKAEIVCSYLNNYDTITTLFDSNYRDAPKIKDIIRNLSGLEIMEQTSTRIVAKNLININEISIKTIVRRIDIITRAMIDDAILCCRGQCTYDSVYQRDADVDRLYFLGYRAIKNAMKNPRIANSFGAEPWQLHNDQLIISTLEKIADRQKRIVRYLCTANLDRETLTELDKVYTIISESYKEAMKAYYGQDKNASFHVETTKKTRTSMCNKLLEDYAGAHAGQKRKSNTDIVAVAKIIENLIATATEIKDISRIVLCYE